MEFVHVEIFTFASVKLDKITIAAFVVFQYVVENVGSVVVRRVPPQLQGIPTLVVKFRRSGLIRFAGWGYENDRISGGALHFVQVDLQTYVILVARL